MSAGTPTAFLLWAILSCIFLTFLCFHLWYYDRFNCLKWDAGRQPGAFKRVMTYSYLATLPLLVIFSVSFTVIKFQEGFIVTPQGDIFPRPFSLWNDDHRDWVLPLYFVLSIAWSLELVTHLEELTFWLFLLHQGPSQRKWFTSWEFRTWCTGSIGAIIGMPLTTILTRGDLDMCLAWIFLVGASAGTSTTIFFLYVLARFPGFIRHVKLGGAEPDVVVRLSTFYQLNCLRVVFRFTFTLPLFVLAVDAIQGPHPVARNPFSSDFFIMIGGIGCFISSAITLLIFFPRSINRELGSQAKINSTQTSAKLEAEAAASSLPNYHVRDPSSPFDHSANSVPPVNMNAFRFPNDTTNPHPFHPYHPRTHSFHRQLSMEIESSPAYDSDGESFEAHPQTVPYALTRPRSEHTIYDRQQEIIQSLRRHRSEGIPTQGPRSNVTSSPRGQGQLENGSVSPFSSQLHPYVMNFTSPIDLLDDLDDDDDDIQHVHAA